MPLTHLSQPGKRAGMQTCLNMAYSGWFPSSYLVLSCCSRSVWVFHGSHVISDIPAENFHIYLNSVLAPESLPGTLGQRQREYSRIALNCPLSSCNLLWSKHHFQHLRLFPDRQDVSLLRCLVWIQKQDSSSHPLLSNYIFDLWIEFSPKYQKSRLHESFRAWKC